MESKLEVSTHGARREIGKFSLTIDAAALQSVVATGRLLELADALGREAAAQIHAQLVDRIADAAIAGKGLQGGIGLGAAFIFEDGDFGTVPPRPRFGIGRNEILQAGAFRQLVSST